MEKITNNKMKTNHHPFYNMSFLQATYKIQYVMKIFWKLGRLRIKIFQLGMGALYKIFKKLSFQNYKWGS